MSNASNIGPSPLRDSANVYRANPIVVLSDMHFGEEDAALGIYRQTFQRATTHATFLELLFDYLVSISPIDELILLGDIFEIWKFPWSRVRESALVFFERLADLRIARVVFCFGNHDHPLLFQHEYLRCRKGVQKRGTQSMHISDQEAIFQELVGPLIPTFMQQGKAVVMYPMYSREVGSLACTFHHGHYLSYLPLTSFITSIERGRLSVEPINLAEMERRWTVVFDAFHRIGVDSSKRERIDSIITNTYSNMIGAVFPTVLRRIKGSIKPVSWILAEDGNVGNYLHAVQKLLAIALRELGSPSRCNLFMFGHIHRAGIWQSQELDVPSLVSLGAWLRKRVYNASSRNVFAVIYPEYLELRQVRSEEVALVSQMVFKSYK